MATNKLVDFFATRLQCKLMLLVLVLLILVMGGASAYWINNQRTMASANLTQRANQMVSLHDVSIRMGQPEESMPGVPQSQGSPFDLRQHKRADLRAMESKEVLP